MQSKKLLVFHPIIAPYRIDFFNELSKFFEIKVCLFWHNLKDQTFDYQKIEQQLSFKPVYLDKKYGPYRKGLFKQLSEFQPDIVLTPEFGFDTILTFIYKCVCQKKFKIVTICDDSYDMLVGKNQFTWKHALAEKILFPFIDDAIVVEPRVNDFIQKKYKKGIFFPIVQKDSRVRNILKRSLTISEKYINHYNLKEKKIFLFVGRLAKEKNLHTVIPIFKQVLDNNSVFIIVGDGPCKKELMDLAHGANNIIFAGRYEGDELYAWYNVADVFILPSTTEPFGAVTNEALLSGCFSLISSKAGSQCLIKEGFNGFKIDSTNIKNIEQRIKSLMPSPTKSKSSAIKENLMVQSFEAYFSNLLFHLKK